MKQRGVDEGFENRTNLPVEATPTPSVSAHNSMGGATSLQGGLDA